VAAQLIFQSEAGAIGRVQLDRVVSSNGEGLAVGREGVVGDGVVEEVVDLRSSHGEWKDRSISLLSLLCCGMEEEGGCLELGRRQ
jgi:hypothetical protein